ncbi:MULTISPECIES: hypothetical protein [unclassified Nostoc]|uniref:hypothetical protein n=1 Tax=unclassified Nostoc TaxID=2593658 RepID=UPI0026177CAC|nr:hypothetical protein [Nostoc sp. S13]MDF5736320.1 hypothetical protein [Nostoc sp. S13]
MPKLAHCNVQRAKRSLKSLVLKAGGVTGTTARFSCDRDQVLAYKRLLLSPRNDADGNSITPKFSSIGFLAIT